MIAVEIEAPIVNHRIELTSDKLPSNVGHARIIVMFEEDAADAPEGDVVALARVARASFPKRERQAVRDEFAAMRDEWNDRGHGK